MAMRGTAGNYRLVHNVVQTHIQKQLGNSNEREGQISQIVTLLLKRLECENPSLLKLIENASPIPSGELEKFGELVSNALMLPEASYHQQIKPRTDIQKLIHTALQGEEIDFTAIRNKIELFKSVVWRRNDAILAEARSLLKDYFNAFYRELSSASLSEDQQFHFEVLIGELLSLYAFLNPQPGSVDQLQLPVKIKGQWELADYTVEPIKLTSRWLGSPLVAFGLKSDKLEAPPVLIFKGTTYPTDEGCSLSLLTDLNPFASVGSYGFRLGKKTIEKWLTTQSTHAKAMVYGKSLGGALSLHTTLHFSAYIQKVMVYGSPGLSKKEMDKLDHLPSEMKPAIHSFCQKDDVVPFVGHIAKTAIQYYHVIGNKLPNTFVAHADMFSTHLKAILIKLNPLQMVQKRKRFVMALLQTSASFGFPFLFTLHMLQSAAKKLAKMIAKFRI